MWNSMCGRRLADKTSSVSVGYCRQWVAAFYCLSLHCQAPGIKQPRKKKWTEERKETMWKKKTSTTILTANSVWLFGTMHFLNTHREKEIEFYRMKKKKSGRTREWRSGMNGTRQYIRWEVLLVWRTANTAPQRIEHWNHLHHRYRSLYTQSIYCLVTTNIYSLLEGPFSSMQFSYALAPLHILWLADTRRHQVLGVFDVR